MNAAPTIKIIARATAIRVFSLSMPGSVSVRPDGAGMRRRAAPGDALLTPEGETEFARPE